MHWVLICLSNVLCLQWIIIFYEFSVGNRVYGQICLAYQPYSFSSPSNRFARHWNLLHCLVFRLRSYQYKIYEGHIQGTADISGGSDILWLWCSVPIVMGWHLCIGNNLWIIRKLLITVLIVFILITEMFYFQLRNESVLYWWKLCCGDWYILNWIDNYSVIWRYVCAMYDIDIL